MDECIICKNKQYYPKSCLDYLCCIGKKELPLMKCQNKCAANYHQSCALSHVLHAKENNAPCPYKCAHCDGFINTGCQINSFEELKTMQYQKSFRYKFKQFVKQNYFTLIELIYILFCYTYDMTYFIISGPSAGRFTDAVLPVYMFCLVPTLLIYVLKVQIFTKSNYYDDYAYDNNRGYMIMTDKCARKLVLGSDIAMYAVKVTSIILIHTYLETIIHPKQIVLINALITFFIVGIITLIIVLVAFVSFTILVIKYIYSLISYCICDGISHCLNIRSTIRNRDRRNNINIMSIAMPVNNNSNSDDLKQINDHHNLKISAV